LNANDLEDDYFDAAQQLYWWCVENHTGQNSDLYRIMCQLDYTPAASETRPDGDYYTRMLRDREIEPAYLLELIEEVLNEI